MGTTGTTNQLEHHNMNTSKITASELVKREVIYCVSTLVYELAQKAAEFPEYEDELYGAYHTGPDYEEALIQSGAVRFDDDDAECWRAADGTVIEGDAEDACGFFGVDATDFHRDVYEHWIVSTWLADKLEAKGEKVLRDFFDINAVWCRTTTGQAISIDRVIEEIHAELIN